MTLRIKEVIKEKGLTIQSIADTMGINRVNLSNSINGNPTVETLGRIAEVLNVPIQELFASPKMEIYGLVQFRGVTYRIDSVEALEQLLSEVKKG